MDDDIDNFDDIQIVQVNDDDEDVEFEEGNFTIYINTVIYVCLF